MTATQIAREISLYLCTVKNIAKFHNIDVKVGGLYDAPLGWEDWEWRKALGALLDGHSYGVAAGRVGRGRNMLIGAVNRREGLRALVKSKSNQKDPFAHGRPKVNQRKSSRRKRADQRASLPEHKSFIGVSVDYSDASGVPSRELPQVAPGNKCCWPLWGWPLWEWGDEVVKGRHCDKPKVKVNLSGLAFSSPYCPEHHKRAYRPADPKRIR